VIPHLRWTICALLFFASTINYIDRQTVAVLKPHLQAVLNWSESDYGWIIFAFQLAYAIMMIVSGGLIDWIGTRMGFALALTWWSLAAMGHALARSARSFGIARFLLGAGEAGNFPASIKTVAEWFPPKERALATGIFNAGTNIGAVLAPPLVVWLTLKWSWQVAFIFTGGLGFIWLIFWLAIYRPPEAHPWISKDELQHLRSDKEDETSKAESKIPWRAILGYPQAWGFILAKFMTDPIWWFYVFWLPSYLKQARGFSLEQIGYFAWIPFLAADVGSVAGGWLSSSLIKRGWSVNRARKTAMAACAFCMPAGIAAVFAPNAWMALALISVATSAHQGWSANVFTLSSDMFPKKDVGSIVGIGGAGGAMGGMIIAPTAGYILQWFHNYVPLFIIAGVMHPLAIALVHLIVPRIEPVQST
jgi:ACS family hexuronate transporter-like MFS transporter